MTRVRISPGRLKRDTWIHLNVSWFALPTQRDILGTRQGIPKLHGVANLVLIFKDTTVFEKGVDIFMMYKHIWDKYRHQ